MKLVTVEATFPADQSNAALAAISARAEATRAMDGCTGYEVYQNGPGIAIVQKWTGMAAFEAYRGSAIFAGLIGALKPLMTAPPVTTIASVDTDPA